MSAVSTETLAVASSYSEPALSPDMPVLDEIARCVGPIHSSIAGLVGLQHLFGSTATLLRRLAGRWIAPENVALLGKPYSANPDVLAFLRDHLGYWTHPDTLLQPNHRPNDDVMDERIRHVLDRTRRRLRDGKCGADKRVLLIDDGGRAIRMLHESRYDDVRSRFACVEQTRCGIRTVADLELEVPVVNVAESWVKLEHESPLIAASVTDQLSRHFGNLVRDGVEIGRRASVIGFGAIGAAVAEELTRSGFDVAVYDRDEKRRVRAHEDGYRVLESIGAIWGRGGVVVGCTGLPVLDRRDHDLIAEGTVLISASSADVEFRAWQIRPRSVNLGILQGRRDDDGRYMAHPCFSLYKRNGSERSFYLLNGGFPVNFDGGVDTIAPDKIQLTRSLLYLGGNQASRVFEAGLLKLDDGPQEMLMEILRSATGFRAA